MAVDRGLPAVPRGLSREMTAYLQSLHNVILSMSGLGRGTAQTRAVRVSERRYAANGSQASGKGFLDNGSILTAHLANGAVTEPKIADAAVTAPKLAKDSVGTTRIINGAVTSEKLGNQSVTTGKLAEQSVTMDKLAPELIPQIISGTARHGQSVDLGEWLGRPLVFLTGQNVPVGECGELCIGIDNLREENGAWLFDATAVFEMGVEDGLIRYPGMISWIALGRRKNDA